MPASRSIWKGVITFGMVTIPVRLFSATADRDISFNQLHAPDHSRLKMKRWCPVDDREVEQSEIVRGYQYAKDQYVVLTDEDFEKLPVASKHAIELGAFVRAEDIDPVYYEKSYYLEPEDTGLKPYALLTRAISSESLVGIGKITLRTQERLCALRPYGGALILDTLFYADEVRVEQKGNLPDVLVSDQELKMAKSLIEMLAEPFEPAKYEDKYRAALMELIEAKIQGQNVVFQTPAPAANVGDLMAALRASVEAARSKRAEPEAPPAAKEPTPKSSERPKRRKAAA